MKKRTPLEPGQQWYAHRALRTARKAAGFKSASAAAESLGFTNAKYRSQEAGRRPISLEDAEQYASAFGLSVETLTQEDLRHRLDRELEKARSKEAAAQDRISSANRATARRLKIARLARGFFSARQAAKVLSLTTPTYLGHEAAKSLLSAAAVRLYAAAFAVNDDWLRNGRLPSGLGQDLDPHLEAIRDPKDVLSLRHLVLPFRPADKSDLAALRAAISAQSVPKWTANAGDVVREISLSDLRKRGLDALHSKPSGFWPLPKGFVRSAFDAALNDLVVVMCDASRERLFVDISRTQIDDQGDFLVIHGNEVMQMDMRVGPQSLPEGAHVVGRIEAKFIVSR